MPATICLYQYAYVHMPMFMCLRPYAYISMPMSICLCSCAYDHMPISICLYQYAYVHMPMFICLCSCAYVHDYKALGCPMALVSVFTTSGDANTTSWMQEPHILKAHLGSTTVSSTPLYVQRGLLQVHKIHEFSRRNPTTITIICNSLCYQSKY